MPKTKTNKSRKASGVSRSRPVSSSARKASKARPVKSASSGRSGKLKPVSGKPLSRSKAASTVARPGGTVTSKKTPVASKRVTGRKASVVSKIAQSKPKTKTAKSSVTIARISKSVRQTLPQNPGAATRPEPPRRQATAGAVRAFEQAVRIFNRRNFAEARPLFETLLDRYPNEVEVAARAQTYLQVCMQKLAHKPTSPRDAEELYDRGVFALNIGDFPQARNFFEKALRLHPNEPHVLYSLAATYAQSGTPDQALDYLTRSIQMQPRLRSQALNDADFSRLREDKRFLELTGVSSPFDLLESRR